MRVYVAAPLACASQARHWASLLRDNCLGVTSRWHDLVLEDDARDPSDDQERQEILTQNLADLSRANAVLALMQTGTPRATNCELGYALALSLPVVWLSGPTDLNTNLFSSHPMVSLTRSGSNALEILLRMARTVKP